MDIFEFLEKLAGDIRKAVAEGEDVFDLSLEGGAGMELAASALEVATAAIRRVEAIEGLSSPERLN